MYDHLILISIGLATRLLHLDEPSEVVFDELHYGRLVSLYVNRTFYFDSNPPLVTMVAAVVGRLAGFDGVWTFNHIGAGYSTSTPIWYLRLVAALCGSILPLIAYRIMLDLRYSRWTSMVAAFLIIFENAVLVQSRFILLDAPLLCSILMVVWLEIKFEGANECKRLNAMWWFYLVCLGLALGTVMCIKQVGVFTVAFALLRVGMKFWNTLPGLPPNELVKRLTAHLVFLLVLPVFLYVTVFYVHLAVLNKAGQHDDLFTSAFQASLEGGLSEITRGQPTVVSYGSQITLRRTHGTPCWLHSHDVIYPQQYVDGRGSSQQQQVSCNSLKGVNNWWIVGDPSLSSMHVDSLRPVRHGDVIQLIHGMTGRTLNSHDVAAPASPHHQEVSCYIEYEMSLPELSTWRVVLLNKESSQAVWKSVNSHIRLIHVNSSQVLRTSGQRLGAWGFQLLEIVTDRLHDHLDAVWNVEEHQYTLPDEAKDESSAAFEDTSPLGFWDKFLELQSKMLAMQSDTSVEHIYSSNAWLWPFMHHNIVYWFEPRTNRQIHLIGNPVIWLSASGSLVVFTGLMIFYLLRRRRACFDLPDDVWEQFSYSSSVLYVNYTINYVPYLLDEQTRFLYQYLPALLFKILLLSALGEHIGKVIYTRLTRFFVAFVVLIGVWLGAAVYAFVWFAAVTYGRIPLTRALVKQLKWFEWWDFISS